MYILGIFIKHPLTQYILAYYWVKTSIKYTRETDQTDVHDIVHNNATNCTWISAQPRPSILIYYII